MKYYLILIVGQIFLGLALFTHKIFSRKSDSFLPVGLIYSALISVFSLPIFAILSGFQLSLDKNLLFYSASYGALAAASQFLIFLALGKVNLVVYSVFSKSSTILVCLCGFIFFNDAVNFGSVTSIILLFAAILIPLFEIKHKEGNKSSLYSLAICVAIMLVGLFIQLVVKGFTELADTSTERASALYFYANAVTALILLPAFYLLARKRNFKSDSENGGNEDFHIGIAETVRKVPAKFYILIPITATIANIPCVTNAYCMMNMDLTIFVVVTKAAESLVYFFISSVIFKERASRLDLVSLALSTLSGIVTVL